MKNVLAWIVVYTGLLASSQYFLKLGVNRIGAISFSNWADLVALMPKIFGNPILMLGVVVMASTFFLWIIMLSWFKLGVIFPLTSLTYIFVAMYSFFALGERLSAQNYLGIALIAAGVFFLLYR